MCCIMLIICLTIKYFYFFVAFFHVLDALITYHKYLVQCFSLSKGPAFARSPKIFVLYFQLKTLNHPGLPLYKIHCGYFTRIRSEI